ncbi:SRPBCC family protein [Sphingomonas sp.]|uniref:SRPBCC family protein n=1 Tax=Sphingomonas sp. TaxID=28214 RepID=UPI003D6CB01A
MTSPAITPPTIYASVSAELDHPIDAVWARIGAFGGLQHWADGISGCSVEGEGQGAIRTVVRNGSEVRERLEAIDPAGHMIRYQILAPHSLPADDVHGVMILRAIGPATTRIVWRSDATAFRVPPEALGARIEQFYAASIEGLRRLLDAG